MPRKSKNAVKAKKANPFVTATIPAAIYLVFYNIISYAFFHETDFLASLFGAIVFWIMYFILQIIKEKRANKK